MPGQITLDTAFGQALREIAADPRYKVWVEIGAWDGEGSTKCIVEGLNSRRAEDLSGAGLFSFEANKMLWAVASRYWEHRNPPMRLLWGRLAERMMSREKVESHPLFEKVKEQYESQFEQDVKDFLGAPLIRMRKADVVVLDGGEFCGEGDWDAVRRLKPRVVVLGHPAGMKNHDLMQLLFVKTGWLPLFLSNDRNGCAILESPGEDEKYYPALPRWWPEA